MLIASNKIRDNLQDDTNWLRGMRRALASTANRWRREAEACMGELGFNVSYVEFEFNRQAEVEKQSSQKFEFYSQPTELAVGAVIAHTAILERKPSNFDALFEIGRKFGRIMLLLDSYRDFESDSKAGRFNALAAAYPQQDWRLPARELFCQSYGDMRKGFLSLELSQPGLLHRLLMNHLQQVGCRSLDICRASQRAQPGIADPPAPSQGSMALFTSNFENLPCGGSKQNSILTSACSCAIL